MISCATFSLDEQQVLPKHITCFLASLSERCPESMHSNVINWCWSFSPCNCINSILLVPFLPGPNTSAHTQTTILIFKVFLNVFAKPCIQCRYTFYQQSLHELGRPNELHIYEVQHNLPNGLRVI